MSLEGKVWRYGDNIDTDVIIPARYLNSFDPKDLAAHCMEDSDEHQEAPFAANVVEGDILVGGKNFGCGSSREHAPVAIKASGVPVVLQQILHVSSTVTALISVCHCWKSAMMWRKFIMVTSCG